MTDEWEPVRRIGTPKIEDAGPGLFNIRVTLSDTPPPEWRGAFIQSETGFERTMSMFGKNPSCLGDAVEMSGAREQDIEFWFNMIDAKIAGANFNYTDQTLPALAAARERQAAEDQRRTEAQARADEIAQRFTKP